MVGANYPPKLKCRRCDETGKVPFDVRETADLGDTGIVRQGTLVTCPSCDGFGWNYEQYVHNAFDNDGE